MPPPSFGSAAPGMAFSNSASLLMLGGPRLRRRSANLGQLLCFIEPLKLPALFFAAEQLMHGAKLQCRDVRITPESGHKVGREECPLSANARSSSQRRRWLRLYKNGRRPHQHAASSDAGK